MLMRKDSPLAEKETICAEDLWDKPLIVSHQTSINTEMFQWLKADISKLNIVATYDLIYNAAQFVKKGFGYVIALDKLINTAGGIDFLLPRLYLGGLTFGTFSVFTFYFPHFFIRWNIYNPDIGIVEVNILCPFPITRQRSPAYPHLA